MNDPLFESLPATHPLEGKFFHAFDIDEAGRKDLCLQGRIVSVFHLSYDKGYMALVSLMSWTDGRENKLLMIPLSELTGSIKDESEVVFYFDEDHMKREYDIITHKEPTA